MNSESPSVTKPSAKTPIVCVTVTIPPSSKRVARAPARPDEVRGHDRLPVARGERVGRTPEHRDEERERDDAEGQLLLLDEAGKATLGGGCGPGGSRLRGGFERRHHHVVARCEPRFGGPHVQWARESSCG